MAWEDIVAGMHPSSRLRQARSVPIRLKWEILETTNMFQRPRNALTRHQNKIELLIANHMAQVAPVETHPTDKRRGFNQPNSWMYAIGTLWRDTPQTRRKMTKLEWQSGIQKHQPHDYPLQIQLWHWKIPQFYQKINYIDKIWFSPTICRSCSKQERTLALKLTSVASTSWNSSGCWEDQRVDTVSLLKPVKCLSNSFHPPLVPGRCADGPELSETWWGKALNPLVKLCSHRWNSQLIPVTSGFVYQWFSL